MKQVNGRGIKKLKDGIKKGYDFMKHYLNTQNSIKIQDNEIAEFLRNRKETISFKNSLYEGHKLFDETKAKVDTMNKLYSELGICLKTELNIPNAVLISPGRDEDKDKVIIQTFDTCVTGVNNSKLYDIKVDDKGTYIED